MAAQVAGATVCTVPVRSITTVPPMALLVFVLTVLGTLAIVALSIRDFLAKDKITGEPQHGKQARGLATILVLVTVVVCAAQLTTDPADYSRRYFEVLLIGAALAEAAVIRRPSKRSLRYDAFDAFDAFSYSLAFAAAACVLLVGDVLASMDREQIPAVDAYFAAAPLIAFVMVRHLIEARWPERRPSSYTLASVDEILTSARSYCDARHGYELACAADFNLNKLLAALTKARRQDPQASPVLQAAVLVVAEQAQAKAAAWK